MLFKLGFYLIILLLIIYFMYKVFVQNAFVVNKRLEAVRRDSRPDPNDGEDVVDKYIKSGKLYKVPLIGSFYEKQISSLSAANIPMKPKEYLLASVGIFIVFLLIGATITGQLVIGLVLGVVGMILPNLYVGRLKKKRKEALDEQLPEFLNTLSNSLRSGLSLQQGINISTEEAQDPVKWEFEKVFNDMTIGRTTESALEQLKERTQNSNIDLLVNAINVQREVGGNLSEVLDLLAATIRQNEKLQRYFKSTVAQNKLSGIIIGVLPVFILIGFTVMSPGYIAPLFSDSLGRLLLVGIVVMMGLGLFVVKKITELEV